MKEKFYLDTKNGMVCGVCSGLSKYFNVDLLLIRILFLMFINVTLYPYILIALIKTDKDKTEDNFNNQTDEQSN